ncbi:MAG: hypothetical protein KGI51_02605 [Rhodospirillales bacterium]|nr:hypothetical protein [Rhodospirillales bacterium]
MSATTAAPISVLPRPVLPPIGNPDAATLVALARRSAARRALRLTPLRLGVRTRLLIWVLRLYVLAMLAVVALQIARLA